MELNVLFLFGFIALVFILNDELKICKERKLYRIVCNSYLKGRLLNSRYVSYMKRIFDIFLASAVLIFIFPLLYIILGTLIKLTSQGPVFFIHVRVGMFGKPFYCFKFRSMYENSGESDVIQNDIRVTPVGRFLRKTHLDEFPQFINVLLGDMSVVGPRPLPQDHSEEQKPRLLVRPGITGWAQINLGRGHTISEKNLLDIHYLEKISFKTDCMIIFETLKLKDNSY